MAAAKITKAQLDLLMGRRAVVEVITLPGVYRTPARTVTAATFHCGDTSIARALVRKGYLETDGVKLPHGKRRAILTEAGKSIRTGDDS